jgi:hypothetical protein
MFNQAGLCRRDGNSTSVKHRDVVCCRVVGAEREADGPEDDVTARNAGVGACKICCSGKVRQIVGENDSEIKTEPLTPWMLARSSMY